MVYLQVGVGSFSGLYQGGGTPLGNPSVNVVSVTVPGEAVLSGAEQQMTSNSTQSISFYDGRSFCAPPAQVYVGGFYRFPNNNRAEAALLQVTITRPLESPTGASIPFSQIRWTSGGLGGGAGSQPVLAGRFAESGTQVIGSFRRNTWNESCLTFFFDNDPAPAGTYEGRVTYTLSRP